MTPSSRERRKEALEWAVVVAEDYPPGLRPLRHASALREMLEEMEAQPRKGGAAYDGKVRIFVGGQEVGAATMMSAEIMQVGIPKKCSDDCPACNGSGKKEGA